MHLIQHTSSKKIFNEISLGMKPDPASVTEQNVPPASKCQVTNDLSINVIPVTDRLFPKVA
jgi:hypothetical protein